MNEVVICTSVEYVLGSQNGCNFARMLVGGIWSESAEALEMNLEVLIQSLRNRNEQLCSLTADELEKLYKKYQELGGAYDAMS